MAKGWATPKSKKKRQRMLIEAEKKWLLGQERARRGQQLQQRQEVANDKGNGQQRAGQQRDPRTNFERVTEAIRRRAGGVSAAKGEAKGNGTSGQPAKGNR